jgi:hypothetical protein
MVPEGALDAPMMVKARLLRRGLSIVRPGAPTRCLAAMSPATLNGQALVYTYSRNSEAEATASASALMRARRADWLGHGSGLTQRIRPGAALREPPSKLSDWALIGAWAPLPRFEQI